MFRGRLKIYLEPRDLWIGAYVAENYVYVCPLPCYVLRWERAASWRAPAGEPICHDCNTHAADWIGR
jgi:hypothetical protein